MAESRVKIFITAIDEASQTFSNVMDSSESMAARLSRTGDTLGELGQLASDFTEPLAKGLKASKNAAIEFESGMAEVRKTTGLGAVQTAELGNEIKKLSRTIPLTTQELTEIGVAAGQSGIAMNDIPAYIKDISKASVALAVDTDKAGLAFGRLANVYGMSTKEIPKLAAAINVLGDSSVASEAEILNVIMRTAALSRQANLTAKDSAALGASFVSLGMAPNVAATAINALLSRMTTAEIQSARFQKGLAMIGMSGQELQNMTSKNGVQAIFALGQAVDKLDPQARAQAIGLMFGAEHSDNVGVFLDRMEVFNSALGSVANDQQNVNRYNEVFATQLDTTESKMQLLTNSFHELAIEIGTALLPGIKAFAAFLTPIINKTTEFAAKHPNIVRLGSALAGLAISIGPLLLGLSALAKAWGFFSAGIPIVAALSNQFLGIGNPISKFLNWLAKGNQRLLGMGDAAQGIKPPEVGELPTVKKCLPICICPEICTGFETKLKSLVEKLDICIPVCICPEDVNKGKIKKPTEKLDTETPTPTPTPEKPVQTQIPVNVETPKPEEKPAEKQNLSLPQIAMLVAALGAAVVAVQKLTDSNASLGEKVVSAATAIGAGIAAKNVLNQEKTEQQNAAEVAAIQQQAAQQLGAAQIANAQELANVQRTNQAAEIATADKIAAGKLLAQQASNQLANQQLAAQLAAQRAGAAVETEKTRAVTAQQVAATAAQAQIMLAARSQMAATDIAAAQAIGAQQVATAQQVGAQQAAAAQQVAAQQVATAQQVAGIQAEAAQKAAAAAEAKAKAEAEAAAAAPPPPPPASSGGGGMLKNALMLGAGALGLGGVAFAVSKVAGGLGGAVGGLFNATKTVAGAVGKVAGGVGKVGGAVGGFVEKGNQISRGVGGVAGGAIGTGIRTFQAGNTAAQGIGQIAGTGIGGAIKSIGAVNGIAKDAGASIGQALGSAIKGTQSLSAAANSAGSGIAGAFSKAGNTIAGSVARVGTVTNSAAANMGGAWSKVQKAAGVTKNALTNFGTPAASAKTGIVSTIGKTADGAIRQAQGLIGNMFSGASKLASSPASKLIGPVAASVAGTVGAASLAGNQSEVTAPPPTPAQEPLIVPPTPAAADLSPTNTISKFTRRAAPTTPSADLAATASAVEKNNIVPLVRSSNSSGRAISSGLAQGINESRPQAELAAAGLAQTISDYLPRSPAERGPLADLDQTGFGLTQEFLKGIDGGAIQSKFEEVLNPPSKFEGLSVDNSSGGGNNTVTNTFAPQYTISTGDGKDLIAELEKRDRQFFDFFKRTQEQFSRGQF
jgi:TP901 family phage tail tape measure protein